MATFRESPNNLDRSGHEHIESTLGVAPLRSISQLVALVRKAGATPDTIANAALRKASRAELEHMLRPMFLAKARDAVRAGTRRMEREAITLDGEALDLVAIRQGLAKESFPLPTGRMVRWGQATVEEHLLRAQWQRQHAHSCVEDAERHESAAEAIRVAGVTCLDEIVVAA